MHMFSKCSERDSRPDQLDFDINIIKNTHTCRINHELAVSIFKKMI